MCSSLHQLTKNLDNEQYVNLKKYYPGERFDLLTQKGAYPYDCIDSVKKLNETSLPPKEDFYSKLNEKDVKDEDYERANKVWKEFNVKNLREYTELYNKVDVLPLADVFENFRDVFRRKNIN